MPSKGIWAYRQQFRRSFLIAMIITAYFEFCTARHADAQTTKKQPPKDTVVAICGRTPEESSKAKGRLNKDSTQISYELWVHGQDSAVQLPASLRNKFIRGVSYVLYFKNGMYQKYQAIPHSKPCPGEPVESFP
jgi:hypothetical protein